MNRKKTLIAFSLILLTLSFHTIDARWARTNGPVGGTMTAFAAKGDTVYAGTSANAVFYTVNNGQNWIAIDYLFPVNTRVTSLVAGYNYLLAGTDTHGIQSYNGQYWTASNAGLTNMDIGGGLIVHNTLIFAGTEGDGIFVSMDNGENWTRVTTGLANAYVRTLASGNGKLFAATRYNGIYVSDNDGQSWTSATNNLVVQNEPEVVRSFAFNIGSVFAATINGVFRSTSDGAGWNPVNTGLWGGNTYSLISNGGDVFVGHRGYGGVFRTTNNGESWAEAGLEDTDVNAFIFNGGALFAGTDGDGVYVSDDAGAGWTRVNTGLMDMDILAITVKDGIIYAGTDGGGVHLSADNGTSWTAVNNGIPANTIVTSLAVSGDKLIAGTQADGLYLSTDDGSSWNRITLQTNTRSESFPAVVVSGSTVYTMDGPHFYHSTDGGVTWTGVDKDSLGRAACLLVTDDALFAGTFAGGIYRSTDDGENWIRTSSGLPNRYSATTFAAVNALAEHDNRLFAGTDSGLFISPDNGETWTEADAGIPAKTCIKALAVNDTMIFAGSYGGEIYLSTDNGTSWNSVKTLNMRANIVSFVVSGDTLYAGTEGGVWSRPIAEIIEQTHNRLRQPIRREADFSPCSFRHRNSKLDITFSLAHQEQVSVKIFNLSGHEVMTLISNKLAAGTHRLTWNTKNTPQGCYTVVIQAGTNRFTKTAALFR